MSNSKNEMANGVDKQVQHILPQDRPLYRTVTFPSPSSRFKFKSPTPKKKSFLGIFSYFLGTVVLATYAANAVVVYQKVIFIPISSFWRGVVWEWWPT